MVSVLVVTPVKRQLTITGVAGHKMAGNHIQPLSSRCILKPLRHALRTRPTRLAAFKRMHDTVM
jgi:hypothetical protein